jgi:hypothetical protein
LVTIPRFVDQSLGILAILARQCLGQLDGGGLQRLKTEFLKHIAHHVEYVLPLEHLLGEDIAHPCRYSWWYFVCHRACVLSHAGGIGYSQQPDNGNKKRGVLLTPRRAVRVRSRSGVRTPRCSTGVEAMAMMMVDHRNRQGTHGSCDLMFRTLKSLIL